MADMSLDEAKQQVWAIQDEIVAILPADEVLRVYPRATDSGALTPCGDGAYSWPASWVAEVASTLDESSVLDAIEAAWSGREGWGVERPSAEWPIRLRHTDGALVDAGVTDGGTRFTILASSDCFPLPDYDPLERY